MKKDVKARKVRKMKETMTVTSRLTKKDIDLIERIQIRVA